MKFPKAVLMSAVDVINGHIDDEENGECLRYQTCHWSPNGYIGNVKLFIKKIAKYLDASVVSMSDYNPIILRRGDIFIGIEYVLNGENKLILRFAFSPDRSFL